MRILYLGFVRGGVAIRRFERSFPQKNATPIVWDRGGVKMTLAICNENVLYYKSKIVNFS